MDDARKLYDALRALKESNTSRSSQQRLLDYCTDVLGQIERFHVDFKEKANARDPKLADDDKKNLAKALSGFANSGGGVLIWGIEDKTLAPKPTERTPQFVSNLLGLASQVTDPVVQGVDGDWIQSDSGVKEEGFALIYVPESALPPHRVVLKQEGIKDRYFIRTGDSFVVAAHTQLEDMFGRRPRPRLSITNRVIFQGTSGGKPRLLVVIGIKNAGRGAAISPYLAVNVHPPYRVSEYGIDGNRRFGLGSLTTASDAREKAYAASDILIYPGLQLDVTAIRIELDPPSQAPDPADLIVGYRIAAASIAPIEDALTITGAELRAACPKGV